MKERWGGGEKGWMCPSSLRSRMRGLPGDDETILREFGDKRVHHVSEVAALGNDGALALVRGAAVEHLGGHVKLGRAAEPVGNRLELPHQLKEFVTERSSGSGVVGDHDRIQAVPGSTPLVVADHPG